MVNISFHNSMNSTRLNAIFRSLMAIIVPFIITIIDVIIVFGGDTDARPYAPHTPRHIQWVPYYFSERLR